MNSENSDTSNNNVKGSILCSLRLGRQEKEQISSIQSGLTPSIRKLYKFFQRWKNIEADIKTVIKIVSIEFAQSTMLFLRAKEEQKITEINTYYQLMSNNAQLIKRLYNLIDDPDHLYLNELFSDKKYLEYLKFIWGKHCP
ncbi:MAG: hypothetical protein HQK53_15825 [Oligoflexia bacterium]|nr:hypothetical protein [Oligoflexia bacterium]